MSKKRVLVVDDMEINRSMIKTFISLLGFDVETANDGLEALRKATVSAFDAIFSDVEMPNVNGFELLARLKKNPATKSIPVIMLTTLDKDEHVNKARQLGAAHYIVKPFNKDKILNALRSVGLYQ